MTRVLHVLLALNVLVSATGVGLYEHLCRVTGRTVSVTAAAPNCERHGDELVSGHESARDATSCCHRDAAADFNGPVVTEPPCCTDHASWLAVDFDGTQPSYEGLPPGVSTAALPVLAKAALPLAPDVATVAQKVVRARRYRPPHPNDDVRVRGQSFQI